MCIQLNYSSKTSQRLAPLHSTRLTWLAAECTCTGERHKSIKQLHRISHCAQQCQIHQIKPFSVRKNVKSLHKFSKGLSQYLSCPWLIYGHTIHQRFPKCYLTNTNFSMHQFLNINVSVVLPFILYSCFTTIDKNNHYEEAKLDRLKPYPLGAVVW